MKKHTISKKYKNKSTKKNAKSKKNYNRKMKGGNCGCNSVITGGLANSAYYIPINTYNNDPNSPTAITDARLQHIIPTTKGGYKKNRKMTGGNTDFNKIFNTVSVPFFNSSNYLNPIVSNGTTAGAITTNTILTGKPDITNPGALIPPMQQSKYLV